MGVRSLAAIFYEQDRPLVIEEVDHGEPGPSECIVRLLASGVCHSMLHRLHRKGLYLPHVLGHEGTGVVEQVGQAVSRVAEGDRVMLSWQPGRPSAAPDGEVVSVRWRDQDARPSDIYTWAEHCRVDERYLVPLPEDVPVGPGSVIGCAVMTGAGAVLRTAAVAAGRSVAVIGAGGVGLCTIAAARRVGAAPIVAVDLDPVKLALATRFGATVTVNAREEPVVDVLRSITGGGLDFAFDTIGVPDTIRQSVLATKPGVSGFRRGGTAVLVGVPTEDVTIDMLALLYGRQLVGCIGGDTVPDQDFPMYCQWYRDGTLPLDDLVTTSYRLEDINIAMDDLRQGRVLGRAIVDFSRG